MYLSGMKLVISFQ